MIALRLPGTALAFLLLLAACDSDTTAPTSDRIIEIAPGNLASCGLADDGRALCWGSDQYGSLGDGSATSHEKPLPVATKERFTQVTLGASHACALTGGGRVWCWGNNLRSQLGVTTTDLECHLPAEIPTGFYYDKGNDCSTRPVPVETSLRFRQIDAGVDQTCGITTGHELWCWGSSDVGNAAEQWTSATPVRIGAPTQFQSLALSWHHGCAIDTEGLGWCWGENWTGALGDGTTTSYQLQPVRIASDVPLSKIAVGLYHSCAVTKAGGALCWGRGSSGQLGDSTITEEQRTPVAVHGGALFSGIAASLGSTCALERGSGAAWCWGENSAGELGDGTLIDRRVPSRVLGGLSFDRIAMSVTDFWVDAPAVNYGTSGGQVYVWGTLPRPLTFEE